MSTPRRRYRIDVTLAPWLPEGHATLVRRVPGELNWAWCAHHVRARSTASAEQKALAQHRALPQCQALDQEIRAMKTEHNLD